ncbi:hypothetical protein B5X24_HaOG200825 [Helicoverpa armigera]|nr:hypothetical protein B5X24_HaOG200825 [Helicoverpa armigera]
MNMNQEFAPVFTVDKDVQTMLMPLNLMQNVFFNKKYRIKNNTILPNNLTSNILSFVASLTCTLIFLYRVYLMSALEDSRFTSILYYSSFFDCLYYCVGYVINFVSGVIFTKKSIEFVFIFQKIHRFISNETDFRLFVIWNWVSVSVAASGYVLICIFFVTNADLSVFNGFPCLFLCIFDFNIVYAMRLIQLLRSKLVLWNLSLETTSI